MCARFALILLSFAIACGPSAAFQQGDDAARTGDWATAVQAYRMALAEDPNDEDTRVRLIGAEGSLVDQTSRRVQAYLAAGDVEGALAEIATPIALLPNDPRLQADLEAARQAGVAQWRSVLAAGNSRAAFEGARRLQATFPQDAELAALVNESAETYGNELAARAQGAEAAGYPALALGLRIAEWTATGSQSAQADAARLRDSLRDELSVSYHATLSGFRHNPAAPALVRPLSMATTSAAEADIRVEASLAEPRFDESWRSVIYTQQYLAGTEYVPNPDYDYMQRQIADQQRDIIYAERAVLDAETRAHRAEVERDQHQGQPDYDSYYARWDNAVDETLRLREAVNRERQDLAQLQSRLASTPSTVPRDVWADYPYEVREHTRWAEAQLDAVVQEGGVRTAEVHQAFSATTTDDEHDAHPIIGLGANPLRYPASDVDLVRGVEDRAHFEIEAVLVQRYDARREQLRAEGMGLRAVDPDRAADRLVRYVLMDPAAVLPDVAAWLDETIGLTPPATIALRP